jgi:hypothetical protein
VGQPDLTVAISLDDDDVAWFVPGAFPAHGHRLRKVSDAHLVATGEDLTRGVNAEYANVVGRTSLKGALIQRVSGLRVKQSGS